MSKTAHISKTYWQMNSELQNYDIPGIPEKTLIRPVYHYMTNSAVKSIIMSVNIHMEYLKCFQYLCFTILITGYNEQYFLSISVSPFFSTVLSTIYITLGSESCLCNDYFCYLSANYFHYYKWVIGVKKSRGVLKPENIHSEKLNSVYSLELLTWIHELLLLITINLSSLSFF